MALCFTTLYCKWTPLPLEAMRWMLFFFLFFGCRKDQVSFSTSYFWTTSLCFCVWYCNFFWTLWVKQKCGANFDRRSQDKIVQQMLTLKIYIDLAAAEAAIRTNLLRRHLLRQHVESFQSKWSVLPLQHGVRFSQGVLFNLGSGLGVTFWSEDPWVCHIC